MMTSESKASHEEAETGGPINGLMYRVTGLLGLTTGIGVIGWGVWSLVATVGTFAYEESGVGAEEIMINNGLNQGLLLSAIVIALGVLILEVKKLQSLLGAARGRES